MCPYQVSSNDNLCRPAKATRGVLTLIPQLQEHKIDGVFSMLRNTQMCRHHTNVEMQPLKSSTSPLP